MKQEGPFQTLPSLDEEVRYIVVKDLHNVLTGELVFKDVIFDHFGDHLEVASKQAEIWSGDYYSEFQNVRVIKATTTYEVVQ